MVTLQLSARMRINLASSAQLEIPQRGQPPGRAHWTHKLFIDKIDDPERRSRLADPENYQALKCNPQDNVSNLPADYLKILDAMPARMRQRFLLGEFASETDSPLWTVELLDQRRILDGRVVDYQRIVIAVDPSGCSGPEDERSDEVGASMTTLMICPTT